MIKLTIEDLQETAEFKVIEKPLIQKPIIAESDVVTIDNNLSTYVTGTQKRELTVNLGYLDREGYEILRGFRDRQYENLKYPKATITSDVEIAPDGQIVESEVTKNFNLTTNDNALGVKSIELVKIGDNEDYVFEDGGRFYVHKVTDKIASYNGETISTDYISTTGELTTGATVYYVLATPVEFEITKGTLVELRYARTYAGQTNVWSESNNYDLPVKLDYTYRKNGAYLPIQVSDSTYEHLTDTLEAPLDITKLGGDTYQQTYNGKNLTPYPYVGTTTTVNGITFTNNNDGSVTINGSIASSTGANATFNLATNLTLPAGTYYVVPIGNISNTGVHYEFYDGSSYTNVNGTNGYSFTLDSQKTFTRVYIEIYKTYTGSFSNLLVYPMLSTLPNQTNADFEPYVGGTASPNPDYPQAVQNVTGLQKIEVVGKNLCSSEWESGTYNNETGEKNSGSGYRTVNLIRVQPNTTYKVSRDGSGVAMNMCSYDKTGSFLSAITISATGSWTSGVNTHYLAMWRGTSGGIDNVQLELGSTITTYEVYKEQVVELNLGKNLLKPITQNYFVNQAVTGAGKSTNDSGVAIELEPNTNYTITSKTTQARFRIILMNTLPTTTTVVSGFSGINKDDTAFDYLTINSANHKYLVVNATKLSDVQIEKGSTATTYAPYFTPIELCKIEEYQDYIYKSGDAWILHKETANIEMADITGWNNLSSGSFYKMGFSSTYNAIAGQGLANIFIYNTTAWSGNGQFGITSSGNLWIMTGDTSITANSVSAWLSNKNAVMYFALVTPTETELTNDNLIKQLEDLYSTYGFDEYTIIETSADDDGNAKPVLEATQGDITGKGTEYRLEGTKKMPMEYKVYGQAIQDGTPSTSTPIPIETVKGNNSITFTGPSGRKDYVIVGKMTLADQRIIDNCGTAEQVAVQFRESKQI